MNEIELLKQVSTELDSGVAALSAISNYHAQTHEGRAFMAKVANAALGTGVALYFQIDVPAGVHVHLKTIEAYTDGTGMTFELLEAPTYTTGSVVVAKLNRDRNSATVSQITDLFSDPTGISAGTELENLPVSGGQFTTQQITSDEEWLLKENATTIVRVTNDDVGNANMWAKIFWYEEP